MTTRASTPKNGKKVAELISKAVRQAKRDGIAAT